MINFEPKTRILHNAVEATAIGQLLDLDGKYGALTVQVVIASSATITFEATVNGSNWIAIRGINKNTGAGATTATASGIFTFAVTGIKKFRARISTHASGAVTVTAVAVPASEPANQATTTTGTVAIDQSTPGTTNRVVSAGAAAHDAAASGNPVQVGGVYRATDPAVADGDAVSLRMNAKGEPLVQLAGSVMEYNETINVPASSFALGTSRNASKHKNILIAVRADATHTWSGSINYQNYNDENITTDVVISSASQVKGASVFVAVKTTNINVLITNSDGASAHNYNTTARLSAE